MSRWIKADLTQQAAAPPAAGDPIAYVTHLEGHDTARVIHSGPEAHIHELRLESGGPWKGADLTDQAGGPGCRDRPMAYLTTFDSVQVARIVYLGTDSHIHELRLEPGARWKKADLTDLAGASGANGAPFGYVTPFDSGGTARVVYPGADGHIHELRLEPGQSWQKADLTDQTGAPGARGAPFAYLTPLNSQGTARVLYAGADGHIHELRLEQGGTWQAADLSAQAQGPNAAGRPAAYLTRFSGAPTARVLYRADDGHVHELRLEPGSSWKHADLTDGANGEAALSDPVGYVTPLDSQQTARVVYLGRDAHVHELRLEAGGPWKTADLTSLAGAPDGAGAPFPYVTNFGGQTPRVVYRGRDSHVQELRLE